LLCKKHAMVFSCPLDSFFLMGLDHRRAKGTKFCT
jgi:hypothetical protein